MGVLKSRCIFHHSKFQEALITTINVIEQGKANQTLHDIVVEACILKAWAEYRLGQLKDAMASIEMGEMWITTSIEDDTPANKRRRGMLLRVKGVVSFDIQLELSLEYQSQAYSLFEEIGDKNRMATSLLSMGEVNTFMGKSESAINSFKKATLLFQEVGNRLGLAGVEIGFGTYFVNRGEHEEAMDCAKRGMKIYQMYDAKARIGGALFIIGRSYLVSGDLHSALEYMEEAITLFQEIGDERNLAWLHFAFGKVYLIKRKSDEAFRRYEQALVIFRKIGDNYGITACLANMGTLLHTKGESYSSLKYLRESLELAKIFGYNDHLGQTLYRVISVAIDMNIINQAQSYLENLQKLCSVQEGEDTFLDQAFRVAQSLILKRSRNPRKRAKAEGLLEQVVREDVFDIELTTDALLTLCSMLIEDLRVSGDSDILQELKTFVNQLSDKAKKQHSYWLLAESYWLQSQISLAELKTKEALQLLSQSQLIAEGHGLNTLALKISIEYDNLLDRTEDWERLAERGAPIAERLDAAQIDEQLERMVKKSSVDVPELAEEEPVQFLLVAAAGGFNLVTKTFQPGMAIDESLVSGFLSAMSSFSEEVFSQSLDRVRIGDYTMLMQYEEPFLFCYVFKGQSYSAIRKMKEFIEVLRSEVSLRNALEHTITTGAVNQAAASSVEDVLTQVFMPAATT